MKTLVVGRLMKFLTSALGHNQSNLDGWWIRVGSYVVVLHCGLGLQLPSLSNLGPHGSRPIFGSSELAHV